MKQEYLIIHNGYLIIIIPFSIAVAVLIGERLFTFWSYRREIKKDAARDKEVNRLLEVDDDLQHFYEKEYSGN